MAKKGEVFINGLSPVTGASGGKALCLVNVCKTPTPAGPPVPIPYANTASSADIQGHDTSVFINGAPVFTENARLSPSHGDEPGTVGGMLSGTRGEAVEPMTASRDVFIGGSGVCRNGDSTWQNKRNALGLIVQQQGIALGIHAKAGEEESPLVEPCAVCKSDGHSTPKNSRVGNHRRGHGSANISRRIRKRYNGELGAPKRGKRWHGHPWCVGPRSLQVHHLIDCAALSTKGWANYCHAFGYDVNHIKNGAVFPAVSQVACCLALPLHSSNHDAAPVYDKDGRMVKKNKVLAKEATDDSQKKIAFHEIYLCYPDAVCDLIEEIGEDAKRGKYCEDSDGFLKRMNRASRFILKKLASFRWTLTPDGRNFRVMGKGCCVITDTNEDEQTNFSARQYAHAELLKLIGDAGQSHKLQVGK